MVQEQSLLEKVSARINIDWFLERFNLSTAVVVETIASFGLGFFAGLFIQKYLKQAIVAVIGFIIVVALLQYMGIFTCVIHWDQVKNITGIGPADTLSALAQDWIAWMQMHVRQVISVVIGFIVGLKVA